MTDVAELPAEYRDDTWWSHPPASRHAALAREVCWFNRRRLAEVALRDVGASLRGAVDHVFAGAVSQTGRLPGGVDLPEDPAARMHLLSGADNLGAMGELKGLFPTANPTHHLDPGPVVRALLVQLEEWVVDGTEPEPSMVPRMADHTAVTRQVALAGVPDAERPDVGSLPYTPAIDPDVTTWPLPLGKPRVALVSALDDTGNEVAGIRLRAVEAAVAAYTGWNEAAVAAYTGWNPRRHVDGLPDVLVDLVGSRLPPGLPAPAPDARVLGAAAGGLVDASLLLEQDLDLAVRAAQTDARGHGADAVGE